jgi:two-component system, response regulator PdtaR
MPEHILVLVAEDEELVRMVITEALRSEGLEVMEAEHSASAMSVLEEHFERIHVLFTDIQMPGEMDGLALAHHASTHWPQIGLLITSARPHPGQSALPGKSRFLAKPYRHAQVLQHVRELAVAA